MTIRKGKQVILLSNKTNKIDTLYRSENSTICQNHRWIRYKQKRWYESIHVLAWINHA